LVGWRGLPVIIHDQYSSHLLELVGWRGLPVIIHDQYSKALFAQAQAQMQAQCLLTGFLVKTDRHKQKY
jgi:hypothetical protein